ncbi:hypothetical protein SVAN01_05119 [Stagonosporopsis vannaccii]|nr:hypothetical protein SVAN01_05119 [Stagonosporopsis vannaccii]
MRCTRAFDVSAVLWQVGEALHGSNSGVRQTWRDRAPTISSNRPASTLQTPSPPHRRRSLQQCLHPPHASSTSHTAPPIAAPHT